MLGTTMAFLTLSMAEIFHAFNMRSLHGSIFTMKKQNWWLIGAGVLSFILTTVVVEFLPGIFKLYPLNITEYLIAFGLSITVIPVVEIVKLIQRLIAKSRNK
jgi:Ca2+-transporting ATPase